MVNSNSIKSLPILLLLLFVCAVAYLPLSSFLFSLKNDAYVYNFPHKFFFSQALHNGYLPIWNPYLNFGFPLFADPGFAWWHPVTWFFGLIGYTAYTFTLEVLFYLYTAGLGMYWLGKKIGFRPKTSFALGCLFMGCGFFVGNLQHINFITAASFLPWLVGCWLVYQQKPTLRYAFFCSLAAYLLFTSGHPALPVATLYFMLLVTVLYYFQYRKTILLKTYLKNQATLWGLSALMLTPLIISYIHIIPFYSRFENTHQSQHLMTGFTLPSFISFFLPFATGKNAPWFQTDVSMRNAYFSLGGIVFFILFLFQKCKQGITKTFLYAGLFLLLLSWGGVVKKVLYDVLPLLSYIRTNGAFRVFTLFSFILCAGYPLDDFMRTEGQQKKRAKQIFQYLSLLLPVLCLIVLLVMIRSDEFRFLSFNRFSRDAVKGIIDRLSFVSTLGISLLCAFFLSVCYYYSLNRKKSKHLFLTILVLDVVINCWLLLPITGVNKTSARQMQSILNKSRKGFPVPSVTNPPTPPPLTNEEIKLIGNWDWYNKEIVIAHKMDYPSNLKSTEKFFSSADTALLKNKPFIFFKSGINQQLSVTSFSPHSVTLSVQVSKPDTLVLLQNKFPGWKAWVDNQPAPIFSFAHTFLAVAVPENTRTVRFCFSPLP